MPKKFLTPIDLNGLELQNAVIQNLGAAPGSPSAGRIYFNTALDLPRIYDGAAWLDIGYVGTAIPTAEAVSSTGSAGTSKETSRADHRHEMPGIATGGADGFMPSSDKTKLDNAVSSNTNSRLVIRDASGRAQFTDPAAAQDAATKNYVDNLVGGISPRASVRVGTTANITLSAPQTIDGTAVIAGDRVLVKNQSTTSQNGVYIVAAGAWTRATDADLWLELVSAYVWVEVGTINADTGWICTVDQGGTLGSTAVVWSQYAASTTITASSVGTSQKVFKQKTGQNLEFRDIKAASTKVAVATVSNDITVDVNEANLTLSSLGGTLSLAKGGTGATTAAAARTALGATGKYSALIGNGALTTVPVNPGLGTTDVIVQLRDASSGAVVEADIVVVSSTVINVIFAVAPATNSIRILVIG